MADIRYKENNFYYIKHKNIKNKKIYNKIVNKYKDPYLKDTIYVLNSGLLNNSFLREDQFKSSTFSENIRNVSIFKEITNNFDVFHLYPDYLGRKHRDHAYVEKSFLNRFYFRKYLLQEKTKNKNHNSTFKNLLKIKKRFKRYFRESYFIGFNGRLFTIKKKYLK